MSRRRGCPKCQDVFAHTITFGMLDVGTGRVKCRKCNGDGNLRDGRLCHSCNGSGRVDCNRCGGTGYIGGD